MREILFRGKRTHNDEWIVGSLHIEKFENDKEYLCCEINQCDVYPETIGQYTGLTDKNGKKIFEGDIVKYTVFYAFDDDIESARDKQEMVSDVKFKGGRFTPIPLRDYCEDSWYSYAQDEFEVIGNIHDNPELLKGGAE